MQKSLQQVTSPLVFSIPEFCEAHKISRTHLYELTRVGRGPKMMAAGRRRLITSESAAAWRASMEQAPQEAAR